MSKVLSLDTETENEINLMAEDGVNHAFIAQQLSVSRAAVSKCIQIKKDKTEPSFQKVRNTEVSVVRELPERGRRNLKKEKNDSDSETLSSTSKKRHLSLRASDSPRSLSLRASDSPRSKRVRQNSKADDKLLKQFGVEQHVKVTLQKLTQWQLQVLHSSSANRKRKYIPIETTPDRKKSKTEGSGTNQKKKGSSAITEPLLKRSEAPLSIRNASAHPGNSLQDKNLRACKEKKIKVQDKADKSIISSKVNGKTNRNKQMDNVVEVVEKTEISIERENKGCFTNEKEAVSCHQSNNQNLSGNKEGLLPKEEIKKKDEAPAIDKIGDSKGEGRPKQDSLSQFDKLNDEITNKTLQKKNVLKETLQEQSVVKDTLQEQSVVKDTLQEQSVVKDTLQEQSVVKEALQGQSIVKKNPQEQNVAKGTLQEQSVGKRIQLDENVVKEAPQDQSVVKEVPQEQSIVREVPQEQSVVEETLQKQSAVEEISQEKSAVNEIAHEQSALKETTQEGSEVKETTREGSEMKETTQEGSEVKETTQEGSEVKETTREGSEVKETTREGSEVKKTTLEGSEVKETTLEGSEVKETTREGGEVKETTREGGEVKETTWEGGQVKETTWEGGEVKETTQEGSGVKETTQEGSGVKETTREGSEVKETTREGSEVKETTQEGSELKETTQEGSELKETTQEGSELKETTQEGSELKETTREGSELKETTWEGSELKETTWEGSELKETTWEGSELKETTWEGSELKETTWEGSELKETTWEGSELKETTWEGSELKETTWEGSELNETTWEGSELKETTWEGSELKETTWEGSELKETTQEGSALKATTQEGSALKATTQEGSALKATTREGSALKATTREGSALKATTREGSALKATTQEGSALKAATREGSALKATTREGSALKATTREGSALKATTREGSALKATTREGSALKATTREGSEVKKTTREGSEVKKTTREGSEVKNTTREESEVKKTTREGSEVKKTTREGSEVKKTTRRSEVKKTTRRSEVKKTTQEGSEVKQTTREGSEVKKTTREGSEVKKTSQEGSAVKKTTREGRTVKETTWEGSTAEGSTAKETTQDESVMKKTLQEIRTVKEILQERSKAKHNPQARSLAKEPSHVKSMQENLVISGAVSKEESKEFSVKKVSFSGEEVEDFVYGTPKYAILDIEKLKRGFENLVCSKCYKSIDVTFPSTMEVPDTEFQVKCPSCNHLKCFKRSKSCIDELSANAIGYDSLYMRLIFSSLDYGGGYRQMESMCMSLGIPHMDLKSYMKHCSFIIQQSKVKLEGMLKTAGDSVHRVYRDAGTQPDEGGVRNIDVTYDGTWIRRGRYSKYGLVVAVDLVTGLVLDYHLMSKYCFKCFLAKKKNPCTFEAWRNKHKELGQCRINYESSPEDMEIDGALILCQRSIQKHKLRYNNLSSRDEGAFEELEMAVQRILNNAKEIESNWDKQTNVNQQGEMDLVGDLWSIDQVGGQSNSDHIDEVNSSRQSNLNQVENNSQSQFELDDFRSSGTLSNLNEVGGNTIPQMSGLGLVEHLQGRSLSSEPDEQLTPCQEISRLTLNVDEVHRISEQLLETETSNKDEEKSPSKQVEEQKSFCNNESEEGYQFRVEEVVSQTEKENYSLFINQEPVRVEVLNPLSEVQRQETLKSEEKTSEAVDASKPNLFSNEQKISLAKEQENLNKKVHNSTRAENTKTAKSERNELEDLSCIKKPEGLSRLQDENESKTLQEDVGAVNAQGSPKDSDREEKATLNIGKRSEKPDTILQDQDQQTSNIVKENGISDFVEELDSISGEVEKRCSQNETQEPESRGAFDPKLSEVGTEGKTSDIFLEIQNFVSVVEQSETSKQGTSIFGSQASLTEREKPLQSLREVSNSDSPVKDVSRKENPVIIYLSMATGKEGEHVEMENKRPNFRTKDDNGVSDRILDEKDAEDGQKEEARDEPMGTVNSSAFTNGRKKQTTTGFDTTDSLMEISIQTRSEVSSSEPMELEEALLDGEKHDDSSSVSYEKKEGSSESEGVKEDQQVSSRSEKSSEDQGNISQGKKDVQKALRKIKSETLRSTIWKKCNQRKVVPWECIEFACHYAIITHNVGIQNFIKCRQF